MCLYAKKAKSGGEHGRGKKIVVHYIAVQHVVSYTVCSSMTAGNAGLDAALCVCVCMCLQRGGASLH